MAAITAGDPAVMQTSASVECVVNDDDATLAAGQGVFQYASAPDFHRKLLDTEQCRTFTEVICASWSHPYVLGVAEGTLHGAPTQAGTFSFTVQVTDSAGGAGSANFTLNVTRKPWIAFRARVATSGGGTSTHTYVVDLSKSFNPYVDLTEAMPAFGNTRPGPTFSPDGTKAVFLADATVDEQDDLIFVGFGTSGVSSVTTLATGVKHYAWAPDSNALVYATADATDNYSVYVIEFNDVVPSDPLLVQQGISLSALFSVTWFDTTSFGYANGYGMYVSERSGSSYTTPMRHGLASCPEILQQVETRTRCSQSPINGVLFDVPRGYDASYTTSSEDIGSLVSRDLNYVARRGSIANTIEVWSLVDLYQDNPALAIPVTGLPPAWAFGNRTLVFSDANGSTFAVDVSQGTPSAGSVSGVPANTAAYSAIGDDDWVLFAGGTGLYVAKNTNPNSGLTAIPIAVLSSGSVTTEGALAAYRPLFAHAGAMGSSSVTELFVSELGATSVVGPTRVSPASSAPLQFGSLHGWTNDGSAVLYSMMGFADVENATQTREMLYLTDLTAGTPAPPVVVQDLTCMNSNCPIVSGLAFQP